MTATDPADDNPTSPLDLIDSAVVAAKRAAHSCANTQARGHFEYGLALIQEAWIAESGQQAREPARVVADVADALNLFAAVLNHNSNA